ncbi:MAG: stage II sporulation protein R [Bacillota bacterium]
MKKNDMNWTTKVKTLWEKEKYHWCGAVIVGVIFTSAFSAYLGQNYAQTIQTGIADKVVRFHVLANSDSPDDQALKLKVRDKILDTYGDTLSQYETKEETLEGLTALSEEICEVAQLEVYENGYEYPVAVSLVQEDFPIKTYEDVAFPSGVYDALRIEIGVSDGENWWCVLYPQMCYVDATWGYGTTESSDRLESTLSEEEYLVVSALESEEALPKIKFKIVEFFQNMK